MNTKYNGDLKDRKIICLHNINLLLNPNFLHYIELHNSRSSFHYKASIQNEIAIYFLDQQSKLNFSKCVSNQTC